MEWIPQPFFSLLRNDDVFLTKIQLSLTDFLINSIWTVDGGHVSTIDDIFLTNIQLSLTDFLINSIWTVDGGHVSTIDDVFLTNIQLYLTDFLINSIWTVDGGHHRWRLFDKHTTVSHRLFNKLDLDRWWWTRFGHACVQWIGLGVMLLIVV